MATTFQFFTDSGLTTPLAGNLIATQDVLGAPGPVVFNLWFGSNTASVKVEADSDPGVDEITLDVADSNPGFDHEVAEVKLSLAPLPGDWGPIVGGAAINLGPTINSGVGGAVEFYVHVDDATGVVGTSTELSITTNLVRETAQ